MNEEHEKYEHTLFCVTDRIKFKEFMAKYLLFDRKTEEEFGYRVVHLGYGKEPFEWEKYTEYLENVGAIDTLHNYYLNFDEWFQMGKPLHKSEELFHKIESELT